MILDAILLSEDYTTRPIWEECISDLIQWSSSYIKIGLSIEQDQGLGG